MFESLKTPDFDGIKLKLASPEQIKAWGFGEVTKPETVNYRTQKPEKDGLFCERIFGPSKDWECYCGKYKKIKYKGIICDKCGVEVTRSSVRRERMGYISLAAPVSHIWFLRGVPSKVGLILDLSPMNLEKVVYFASFIVTKVEEGLKEETVNQIKNEYKSKKKEIKTEFKKRRDDIEKKHQAKEIKENEISSKIDDLNKEEEEMSKELDQRLESSITELDEIKKYKVISEASYHELSLKYGHIFKANIGAEAIRELLGEVNLKKLEEDLEKEIVDAKLNKRDKLVKRIKLVKNFMKNDLRPEWMIFTIVPIIPPDLRPMVPLDGGRFATSDLNDLYRRIINRNNRLKQLIDLNAPEVICRNEKRMLQEAVDALIDNTARQGKTVVASTGQKRMLKSLADMLKGKQGRFRQNLLGKRTDYSGRSVIVVGPDLQLSQCGLPKTMALELFRPFIISQLIKREIVHNVRSANRYIEAGHTEVWDILEEIIKGAYVLLNRAPTLHRLGIQAFRPKLIEGKAIQIHPMVCSAFNADFDGDQMAVHIPLTDEAKFEAEEIMLSSKNLLKPATGDPVTQPNQDIVWGIFYMTVLMRGNQWVMDAKGVSQEEQKSLKYFSDAKQAIIAYNLGIIKLQQEIAIRQDDDYLYTTVGRVLFNEILPSEIGFLNKTLEKKALGEIVIRVINLCGRERAVELLDDLKNLGFKYLTTSGLSWGMGDTPYVEGKQELIEAVDRQVEEVHNQYELGLLTFSERHSKIIELWSEAKDRIVLMSKKKLAESFGEKQNPIYSMIESKARGSWGQLIQIIGMKGLVTNPSGKIIELPVKGNFKEGVDVLEYFISTHGARKGLSDTALRTASAGYLTRRLVDVSQDIIVQEEDCHDKEGVIITKKESEEMGEIIANRIWGRVVIDGIKDPETGEVIAKAGDLIDEIKREKIKKLDINSVKIRSILTCKCEKGICRKCYGYDLGYNKLVELGTAVGIIAAQSIGEPGTQLTMRTFHTGGVAAADITQGLPRVEEIFEVRPPKRKAFVSEVSGQVTIEEAKKNMEDNEGKVIFQGSPGQKIVKISYDGFEEKIYEYGHNKPGIKVKNGDEVKNGEVLFVANDGKKVLSQENGLVRLDDSAVTVLVKAKLAKEYVIPKGYVLYVKSGDMVEAGDALTEGSLDLHQLYSVKGRLATQKYIIKEIQYVYSSQGQPLNDKHIEIIGRQLFSKVFIRDAGDSELLSGDVVDMTEMMRINDGLKKKGKKVSDYEKLLLGITKVSLSTKSFLSAASFQETSRVLINAAISGKIDYLEGLKENVIIGRLIPTGTGFKKTKK